MDPQCFYTDLDTGEWPDEAYVKPLCKGCPVRAQCVDRAVTYRWVEEGYWGSTLAQRTRIKTLVDTAIPEDAVRVLAEQLVVLDA